MPAGPIACMRKYRQGVRPTGRTTPKSMRSTRMRKSYLPLAATSLALALAACSNGAQETMPAPPAASQSLAVAPMPNSAGRFVLPSNVREVCPGPAPIGFARCIALVRTDVFMPDTVNANVAGYGPTDLQSAYNLPSAAAGSGQTVAIVDAFNDKHAESDLGVYRTHFGLSACTTANGCFKKVNESGNPGPYPPSNSGWTQEISLDLDMVSAVCPNCHIILVEASSASFNDLAASVDTAARLGANEISNSYGGGEFSGETSSQSHYNHPGVMITASSGDSGYGAQFPAASQYVTAVGGTSLTRSSGGRGWTET